MLALGRLTLPALFSLTLLASGCASYRNADSVVQNAQLPATTAPLATEARYVSDSPVAAWWRQLHDAPLDDLVTRALQHNHSLRIAAASLAQSRALLQQANLLWLPEANIDVSATRQQQSGNPMLPNGTITESAQAGVGLLWEADLFGRIPNAIRGGMAQAEASADDLRAAQVSVAAEVASAYVTLRGTQHLLDVANDNVAVQQKSFELTQRLAELGRGNQFDVVRAKALLERTQAAIPSLQADLDASLNRLAVLTAQDFAVVRQQLAAPAPLPSLPASVAIGDARSLLQRRPDVRRADAQLRVAVAAYNVQVADYYPRIDLTGTLGYQSSNWNLGGGWQSGQVFTFGPGIRWGILNLSSLRAKVKVADARVEAGIAGFERSVLLALEETDNALRRFSSEEARRLHLLAADTASRQAAGFAQQRFDVGTNDFLTVLDAQRSQLETSAELAQSETRLLLDLIGVYRALGGGWDTPVATLTAN